MAEIVELPLPAVELYRDQGMRHYAEQAKAPNRLARRGSYRGGPIWRALNRHDQVQPGRLTDKAVVLIVKRAARRAGLDLDTLGVRPLLEQKSRIGGGGCG